MLKNLNQKSKIYIIGIIASIIILFLLTSVIFMCVVSDKLDLVFSQKPGITYTYFISIMDRVLAFLGIFAILPLTIYQIFDKEKTPADKSTSIFSIILLTILIFIFVGGEFHYYKKYKNGELLESKIFSHPTIEMKIFDKF